MLGVDGRAGWPAPRPNGAAPGAGTTRRPGSAVVDHVRPGVRLRDGPVPLAAGRGAAEAAAGTRPQHEWQLAMAAAERLGAAPLLPRSTDLGRRRAAGLAATCRRGSQAGVLRGLTAREHEVLRLLAAGRTNREIARGVVHRAEDRQRARVEHPGQAGRGQPDRSRGHRAPGRPHRERGKLRRERERLRQERGGPVTAVTWWLSCRTAGGRQPVQDFARPGPRHAAGSASGAPTSGSQLRS